VLQPGDFVRTGTPIIGMVREVRWPYASVTWFQDKPVRDCVWADSLRRVVR
jgi:hypothetical protein